MQGVAMLYRSISPFFINSLLFFSQLNAGFERGEQVRVIKGCFKNEIVSIVGSCKTLGNSNSIFDFIPNMYEFFNRECINSEKIKEYFIDYLFEKLDTIQAILITNTIDNSFIPFNWSISSILNDEKIRQLFLEEADGEFYIVEFKEIMHFIHASWLEKIEAETRFSNLEKVQ